MQLQIASKTNMQRGDMDVSELLDEASLVARHISCKLKHDFPELFVSEVEYLREVLETIIAELKVFHSATKTETKSERD